MAIPILTLPVAPAGGTLSWRPPAIAEQAPGNNILTSGLQALDGSIWIAWQSDRSGTQNIYYKTLPAFGSWGATQSFTTGGGNATPALVQLPDGTIFLIWAGNLTGNFNLYYKTYTSSWSNPVRLTNINKDDSLPVATVARDGTLWLVWTRQTSTTTNQLFYKILRNNVWSNDVQLTTDTNINLQPSVVVGKDSLVRVVWSKGSTAGSPQIYYKTFNGTIWSSETQIVSSADRDAHPSLIQARDGSFQLFWHRAHAVGAVYSFKIWTKSSVDNAQTWSAETQLTFDPSGSITVDEYPVAIQSTSDNTLWVFYSTNSAKNGEYDIYDLQSSAITGVHDVKISSVTSSNYLQYPGGLISVGQGPTITVYVTVANPGDFLETVTVTASVSTNVTSRVIGIRSGNTVVPGGSIMLSFNWNTANVSPAKYILLAKVNSVPGESVGNTGDNTMTAASAIWMLPLGDIDQDGSVTITDVSVFFYNYGFSVGSPRYNPYCDISGSGTIDIIDVGVATKNYGINI